MPAYGSNNQPDPTRCNDYYCDANNVCAFGNAQFSILITKQSHLRRLAGGVYCPEMDVMEANTAAIQARQQITHVAS
jgi:hypothetical protein